ncbi:MAG: tRNA glutamyl-Q(34) synthetase GluQRS [Planctomycetota bacterium]
MSSSLRTQSVGRLAPSPTGLLHVGHARSFLLAWWHARASGGRIVLRLEDLDGDRVKSGMAEQCLADLAWLGLDWDGPVEVQSKDPRPIAAALDDLLARGLAYPCTCSRKEIEAAQSAPHPGQEKGRYPGTCRGKWRTLAEAEAATGRPAAARLVVEPGAIELVDAFVGPFRSDPFAEVGDFPIARRAGAPAYQLAVVVDDGRAGITDVVRGDDLLSSTARQWLLQRALGLPHPAWHHVPLVVDEGGRRLAKRSDDLSLAELRARGVSAERVVAWVARRSGIPDAEPATAARFVPGFTLKNVPRTAVVLDRGALAELVEGR